MELFARTLEALDWPFVTTELASHARTAAGRRTAENVALLDDSAAIADSFDAIDEVLALLDKRVGTPPLGGVEEISEALERAARGEVLELIDLRAARCTLGALGEVNRFMLRNQAAAPTLAGLAEPIDLDRKLCAVFDCALDERGELAERTYPVLGQLRERIASLERRVRSILEGLLDSLELADVLQDRYITIRDDRFVLPIKVHAKGLGLGIVHDVSRSGQTVFVEPLQLVPLGNDKRIAEAELRDEERRIRADLSALLGRHADALHAALAAATELDLACARADFAARLDASRPVVGRDAIVDLRIARHPVLALTQESVVPNDLSLTPTRPVLVLTGPNAGGKTVAMKTIGLCALLVRAGCFVPAGPGSRVDVFDEIFADIGDMQTVHEGLSSFSAHLTTLRSMLERAGPGVLLLLDEIAAGTDPAQGGALARAVIERLADVGARVVVTTHYGQIKAMSAQDSRVEVSALEYRGGKPTYRVVPGTAGESHALAAAARVGIDDVLVERARTLMDQGERALHEALASLEVEREAAREASARAGAAAAVLAAREREVAERESALAERERKIKGRARELEQQYAQGLIERLRSAEDEVRRAVTGLGASASREQAARARSAIDEARALATAARAPEPSPGPAPRVGDRVRLSGLGTIGEVVALRAGEVEVRAGAMTVRARPDEVQVITGTGGGEAKSRHSWPRGEQPGSRGSAGSTRGEPTASVAFDREAAASLETALRIPDNTLDLRGVRVEQGLAMLETFLDESLVRNRDVVFVLHGHGTGAMRSAIRRALAESHYVSESAPASEDQGGDAFSVARLRG
ncbi:MAG: Smr/MutS family protein [Deltaproteobacteria bacterium]|nr:Smr/MutS family protein [Deltaproteobacteria bacterium]